jgi:acyl-CoA synthetase (AMP-forming)/AMP-acid ligase II
MALLRAGASLVLADIGMGKEAFESRMRLAKPRWVFAETLLLAVQGIGPLRRIMRARGVEIPLTGSLGEARIVNVGPRVPLLRYSLSVRDLQRPISSKGWGNETQGHDDEAVIVFTSGTTGLPRGVVHSVGSISATMEMIGARLRATSSDVVYASSLHLVISALCAGAVAVLPPLRFKADEFLRDLERYRTTVTFAIPGDLEKAVALCQEKGEKFPESLGYVMLGSAPVPTAFLRRLQRVLSDKTQAWDVYGMTEMLPICDITLSEKVAYEGPGDLVGRPVLGACVRLAEDGEVVVSGPNLFMSVLGSEGPPVREHFTGDTGVFDEEGRLVLTGRKKDMIIKAEHNIYPALFEPAILRIPGVKACAMVGVYHEERSDEEIVLVVEKVAGTSEAEVERTLRREMLDGPNSIDIYAQPDRIVFVGELPRSGRSSKIDKKRLREMLAAGEM